MERIPRLALSQITAAMEDTRVVSLLGARQVGKSTLAQQVFETQQLASSFTLDDQATRAAALNDPTGFVAGLAKPTVIDEVQRAPELLYAIKRAVDTDQTPGQFLLTGSANLLTAPRINEALTGRMEIVRLYPLAQAEIEGSTANFVDALFAGDPPQVSRAPIGREAFVERLARGGYPEARLRNGRRRATWYRDYLTSLIQRDLNDLASLDRADEVPGLLRLLATQAGNIVSLSKAARHLTMSDKTAASYVKLLEDLFILHRVRPWRPGLRGREVRSPKLYVVDSGLLLYLLTSDQKRLAEDDMVTGKALESFCGMELLKHISWSRTDPELFHYRDRDAEIDIVLEARNGDLACVEVKAAATVRDADHRVMRELRDARADRFKAGVVIYTGEQTIPLADRIWAVPIGGLWA